MLTRLYVEAILADADLADQVWELWNVGMIPDGLAAMTWLILVREHCGVIGMGGL